MTHKSSSGHLQLMQIGATVLFLLFAFVFADEKANEQELFNVWMHRYNKSYASSQEYLHRMNVFTENFAKIIAHNSDPRNTFTMSLNKFADLTSEEFSRNLLPRPPPETAVINREIAFRRKPLPPYVNWARTGVVPAVTNEGEEGDPGVIVTIQELESMLAIGGTPNVSLSTQQLLDCTGENDMVQEYLQGIMNIGGIESAADYPSSIKPHSNCQYSQSKAVAKVTSYSNITTNNENALQVAVAQVGPVAAAVDASLWQFYTDGIFNGCTPTPQLDHVILVVGYGSSGTLPYWILQNEWGTDWGMNGFMWLARNDNNMCGIASSACYAQVV